ncbi:MAG: RHS repeat-associated core domain-containing protein [Bacteroidales bacterium]|nr:RHS repeat-associated core domain-containing protein [Bacteroidales bacterium]
MNPLNVGLSIENAKKNKSSLQTRTSLGRMRNPQNWIYASVQEPQLINRGYTGHEMLPEFDLINMNGRCYDPVVGRFLSTDNFVQDPFSSQCYNRYSYCLNNPLKYSDPSGEIIWAPIIATSIWLGAFNLGVNYSAGNIDNFSQGVGYFGIGLAAGFAGGVAGAAVGSAIGSIGFLEAGITGAAGASPTAFITGSGNSWMCGASFGEGLWAGTKSSLISGGISFVTSGLIGGIAAKQKGGGFLTGAGIINSTPSIDINGTSGPVEYDNSSAREFAEKYTNISKKVKHLYADHSMPEGYYVENGAVCEPSGIRVDGATEYRGWFKSDVYLFPNAFQSKEQLYIVMQHEFIHVNFNAIFSPRYTYENEEATARLFSLDQGKAWGYKVNTLQIQFNQVKNDYLPKYHYSRFGFNIRSNKPW